MPLAPLEFHLTDEAREDLRQVIAAPLKLYNEAQVGPSGYRALVVTLTRAGTPLGGLWGYTSYGWLYVQLLALDEAVRGQGAGRELLLRAEAEAISRGCHGAWLDTHEFQARGFYERLGYELFGELADYPPGFARYFLRKALTTGPASNARPG
ncbi:acetyltransferase [Pseudomonas oryzihabitans]|uniref:GNAT family N-acetyltransferase n=1 Tax=Pseudomonas rhizoryzae TaxID=2571129 RepID=UPI000736C07E|nr:GNAT family N-acetyltransferase [Pseudomonas rhizoryzae]KTS75405.1 acetyltransferase [Pseudomonas psychrotolerans]KTT27605.1 acetyltransferase [Pseudomonas psychrotolerans]KTT29112.1 acetyltransferase [Pseudomonas psychrotolerans]KTT39078.1 acetyltransferase [Pseudomonas psychrotolerans]KTT39486.1 acetyltransferase [Pseudomonas psychrotolerans]